MPDFFSLSFSPVFSCCHYHSRVSIVCSPPISSPSLCSYIQQMDDEMQSIVAAVKKIHPQWDSANLCRPLRECLVFHYAELIGDPTDLFTILRTNKGYAKHHITYKTVGEGMVIPDGTKILCCCCCCCCCFFLLFSSFSFPFFLFFVLLLSRLG